MRSAAIWLMAGGLSAMPAVVTATEPARTPAAAPAMATPSFADVLAAPDDPAINIAYAKAQIAAGNMLYAAAAYERLLLERPDQDGLRLDYVDVLLNLDDPVAARRELDKLTDLQLPAAQQTQLAGLRERLAALSAGKTQ